MVKVGIDYGVMRINLNIKRSTIIRIINDLFLSKNLIQSFNIQCKTNTGFNPSQLQID